MYLALVILPVASLHGHSVTRPFMNVLFNSKGPQSHWYYLQSVKLEPVIQISKELEDNKHKHLLLHSKVETTRPNQDDLPVLCP